MARTCRPTIKNSASKSPIHRDVLLRASIGSRIPAPEALLPAARPRQRPLGPLPPLPPHPPRRRLGRDVPRLCPGHQAARSGRRGGREEEGEERGGGGGGGAGRDGGGAGCGRGGGARAGLEGGEKGRIRGHWVRLRRSDDRAVAALSRHAHARHGDSAQGLRIRGPADQGTARQGEGRGRAGVRKHRRGAGQRHEVHGQLFREGTAKEDLFPLPGPELQAPHAQPPHHLPQPPLRVRVPPRRRRPAVHVYGRAGAARVDGGQAGAAPAVRAAERGGGAGGSVQGGGVGRDRGGEEGGAERRRQVDVDLEEDRGVVFAATTCHDNRPAQG